MSHPPIAELQRWSEEVARDPASPAFVPLARAYRRQGRREAALRLCLRALDRQPLHVEGHALLALLYLEGGERQKACDAWSTVLRLDPEHFEAHRGMGFYALEQQDPATARRHLQKAASVRPGDPAVREALQLVDRLAGPAQAEAPGPDPAELFQSLLAERALLGVLLLDDQGLVLAGSLKGDAGRVVALGALLGGAAGEAARAAELLRLGRWRGLMLECAQAIIHLAPLDGERLLLVAAAPGSPAGWMLHVADRAARLARDYLENRP